MKPYPPKSNIFFFILFCVPPQEHGSFYCRVQRQRKGVDPRTGEETDCLRSCVEQVEGNVLSLFASGDLMAVLTPASATAPSDPDQS